MYLLYCDQAGTVVAYYDDASVFTPLDAYPTAVRIIPYDLPISTLEKVGAPPPAGKRPSEFVDTRPYAQPAETPELLKLYAGQCRFNRVDTGFDFTAASGVIPVWTDRQSYMLLGGLATYAASVDPTTIIDFTQGSSHYILTAVECVALFNEFSGLMQLCRTAEADCLDEIGAGTILTYDDVDAQFAGAVRTAPASSRRPLLRRVA